MQQFLNEIEKTFHLHGSSDIAKDQQAYMKDQFSFLGIKKPLREELQKECFKKLFFANPKEFGDFLDDLWNKEEREFQYAALDLAKKYPSFWDESIFSLFCKWITEKSWWDTVDLIASNLIGIFLLKNKERRDVMVKWIDDDNLWRKRTALLYQLRWKSQTEKEVLFSYCVKRMHDKDFFIRKAIGWVLREYSKSQKEEVTKFIEMHQHHLSPLSLREARKYL